MQVTVIEDPMGNLHLWPGWIAKPVEVGKYQYEDFSNGASPFLVVDSGSRLQEKMIEAITDLDCHKLLLGYHIHTELPAELLLEGDKVELGGSRTWKLGNLAMTITRGQVQKGPRFVEIAVRIWRKVK